MDLEWRKIYGGNCKECGVSNMDREGGKFVVVVVVVIEFWFI